MKHFTQEFTTAIETKLEIAVRQSDTNLQIAEKSIFVLKTAIEELKIFLNKHSFKDACEEILFFKEFIPSVFCQLIYHLQLFQFESRRPLPGSILERKQLHRELKKIEFFFADNRDFYSYCHSNANFMDEVFFMRGCPEINLITEGEALLIDSRYCTAAGFKVAKLKAFEMLQQYYILLLNSVSNQVNNPMAINKQKSISWTDSKAALIELIYAFYSCGSVNNGKANVNELAMIFENAFNIKLGNFYRTFQNMRIRKKSRTNYLDLLKDNLEKLMNDADDRHSG